MSKKRYVLTPARRRALRKAQQASARRRFGAIKHDAGYWYKKGITKGSSLLTLTTSKRAAQFAQFVQESKKKK